MGDFTGPVATLPGTPHQMPNGSTCDVHADRPAVRRVQGETDSMGCELVDMCQECLDAFRRYREEERTGACDWCGANATDLRDARDYDEGLSGPVYRVCGGCRKRQRDEAVRELDGDWP